VSAVQKLLAIAAAIALAAFAVGCSGTRAGDPLAAGRRVTLYGADAGDNAGAIAAGDFNGDGVQDVVLAAAGAGGPDNARPESGEAYMFLGPFSPGERRDPAEGQHDLVIYGDQAGDQLGRALAAGDFNGDGIDDIALGAPFADGTDETRLDSGQVDIVLGSARLGDETRRLDLAEGPQFAAVIGADADDLAGFALHAADLNGDGASDLIIGAFRADGPGNNRLNAGELYVIYGGNAIGRIDIAAGQQDVTVYGAEAEDRLGEAVGAGDVSGDGLADVIVAATFASGPDNRRDKAGETYVLFAPLQRELDMAARTQDITILGIDSGDQIGHSIASGDANGDGFADIFLGAVSADGPNNGADLAGEAYLIRGGDSSSGVIEAADGAAALIYGAGHTYRLGRSAASGDINGDGLSDFVIAAPDVAAGNGSRSKAGAVYVFYGRKEDPYPVTTSGADVTLEGLDGGDILGHEAFGMPPLATADVNDDGLADVLVSAPSADGPRNRRQDSGEAYLILSE
jgi:hypothetical protein